jgi:hypothetical protein
MNCLLIPGSLPTVLGSVQFYNKEFEDKANLVIHAEHIAMSGNQLVLIPGAVKFQGKEYFCRAVTYEFVEQPEQDYDISAILTLTDIHTPPKASPLAWQMVNCRFQGWEESAKEKKYIKLKLENGARLKKSAVFLINCAMTQPLKFG